MIIERVYGCMKKVASRKGEISRERVLKCQKNRKKTQKHDFIGN